MRIFDWKALSEKEKDEVRKENNPLSLPTGLSSGRCKRCHSKNLSRNKLLDISTLFYCDCCGSKN